MNATGLQLSVTEWNPGNGTNLVQRRKVNYSYDVGIDEGGTTLAPPALHRLSVEDYYEGNTSSLTGEESFLYDPVGNRRIFNTTGVSVTGVNYNYTIKDQFDAGSYFGLDANGNITNTPTSIVDYYDAENNLVKRTSSAATIRMGYNPDGTRAWRQVDYSGGGSHKTIYFLTDDLAPTGYPQILLESVDTTSTPSQANATFYEAYEWGHGLNSVTHNNGTTYTIGRDGHGSVRMLLDGNGNIISGYVYDYDAYGNLLNSPTLTVEIPFRYSGYEWDQDMGMNRMGPRFYDPKTGRFWQTDSFLGNTEDPTTLHLMAYCAGDPVNHLDPEDQ